MARKTDVATLRDVEIFLKSDPEFRRLVNIYMKQEPAVRRAIVDNAISTNRVALHMRRDMVDADRLTHQGSARDEIDD